MPAVSASVAWADDHVLRTVIEILVEAVLSVLGETPETVEQLNRISARMRALVRTGRELDKRETPRMRLTIAKSVSGMAEALATTFPSTERPGGQDQRGTSGSPNGSGEPGNATE